MANLTLERLVERLEAPRARAGYSTVIFKEDSRGRTLHRVLASGEPYRPGVLERLGCYEAYAVSANPVIRHRFSEQLGNGIGQKRVGFTSHVTLSFRVSQPDVLVERLEDDPLGLLEAEAKGLLRDWSATVTYEALLDPEFDVAAEFLGAREGGEQGASRHHLERLQEVGAAVGLLLEHVDISRQSSIRDIETGEDLVEEDRKQAVEEARALTRWKGAEAEAALNVLDASGRARVRAIEAGTEVIQSVVARFDNALANVARDTSTPQKLREAVREVLSLRDEIFGTLSLAAAPSALDGRALTGGGAEPARLAAGARPALGGEVDRLLEVVGSLDCTPAERSALVGRILHVLAELCLAGEDRNGALQENLNEVTSYCERIGLERVLAEPAQLSYFRRFHEAETLRRELAGLAEGR
jgi:hypothetical protein